MIAYTQSYGAAKPVNQEIEMNERKVEGLDEKNDAINQAFHIAHQNEIAGYAIETKYGWIAAERKPSIRFGLVYECLHNGSMRKA